MLKPTEKSARSSRFLSQEDGSVAILSAVAMVAMIGTAGLALEYGNALLVKNTTQRAVDLAVYSAAVEYTESGDTHMQATADNVLELNGVTEKITLVLDSDKGELRGTVDTSAPLGLTRVIQDDSSVAIGVSATALLEKGKPNCIVALDSDGSGIDIRGAVSIDAQGCAIASGSSVEARGCTYKITTSKLMHGRGYDLCDSDNNVITSDGDPAPIESGSPEDPLKDSAAKQEASEILAAIAGYGGPDITLSKKNEDLTDTFKDFDACTANDDDGDGSSWTVSCNDESKNAFGKITVGKGYSLTLKKNNNVKYLIGGDINIEDGGFLKLAGGAYQIEGAIEANGAAVLGGGTYAVTDYVDIGGSLTAEKATFIIGGRDKCKNSTAFCIANGDDVTLSPPDSGDFEDIAVMGPFNPPNGNAEITTGNTHMNASGKFYFPEGNLEISGNSSVSGKCLELITKKLYLTGTVSITTNKCGSGATSDNVEVRLIK